jgi:nickel/cobalt exporter
MMAAFIIAIRGSVRQAILLGLAATASHTLVVWGVALIGMRLGSSFDIETSEPYFQVISAALILAIASWMIWRTWREQRRGASHAHDHHHHHHAADAHRIDTGHGVVELSIQEDGMPPRFWLCFEQHGKPAAPPRGERFRVETVRADGTRQFFDFEDRGRYLESTSAIPEPHEFTARVEIEHDGNGNTFEARFVEHAHAGHDHGGLDVSGADFQDAHERAHADDIRRRFADRNVTTAQIVMFGLTGGLIPCPAAITVLLLCLQLKQFTLGVALVLCFSIGLALTMVTAGVIAALSVRHVSQRWSGFATLARRAPYFSGALIVLVGLYVGYQGLHALVGAGVI